MMQGAHRLEQLARLFSCGLVALCSVSGCEYPIDDKPGDARTGTDVRLVDMGMDVPVTLDDVTELDAEEVGEDTPDAGPGATYSYVISLMKVDTRIDPQTLGEILDTLSANPHTGFNVDGRFSDMNDVQGCLVPDFYSKFDADQHQPSGCAMVAGAPTCIGGVDNQMLQVADALSVALPPGGVNGALKTNIDSSKLVLLIRVSGVHDLTNDPDVTLKLYRGFPSFSTMCAAVLPDREYKISTASLTTGSNDIENALYVFSGSITNGRLHVNRSGATSLPTFPGFFGGALVEVPFNNTTLSIDLGASGGSRGNFGGWVKGNDIRAATIALAPGQTQLVDQLLPTFLDVVDPNNPASPMNQCGPNVATGMPATWGGISAGYEFLMVRALINPTPIASLGPDAGTCGR